MKRGLLLVVLLIGALGLSACGEKDNTDKGRETAPEVTKASPEATEAEVSTEAQKEAEEEKATEVEPGTGEGAPDAGEPMDMPAAEGYKMGEPMTFTSGGVSYELVIDRVEYTDNRNQYVEDPGDVLLVTYTYKNLGEGALLIDDMRFQLMNQDKSKTYELYYIGDEKAPESIEKGAACTAQISYAVPEKETAYVLGYQDTVNSDIQPAAVLLDNIE